MSSPSHPDTEGSRKATRQARGSSEWSQRCAKLFEDLRKPARAMVCRAYGRALNDEEIEDVYSAAWAATLSALRTRGDEMSDEELRAYVLTAVASHASKELRRRKRKQVGAFEDASELSASDSHQPLPEERAIGLESRGIARDLLTSLPPRRRAVMLLRYGWGLSPTEVCALVDGLSSRAYRKEVSRGIEQLIERFKQVESGEWCESREPLLRDYIAGTADEETERQVKQHLQHCRACSRFAARLNGHLHDLGGAVALTTVAGSIGGAKLALLDRFGGAFHGSRDSVGALVEKSETTIGTVAASGGARGSGALGAGVVAKLAGLGGAGKAVVACLGAGAAATACVAAGVVPGVSLTGSGPDPDTKGRGAKVTSTAEEPEPTKPALPPPTPGVNDVGAAATSPPPLAPVEPAASEDKPGNRDAPVEVVSQPPPAPLPPSAPPPPTPDEQEFDPLAPPARAPSAPTTTAPAPSSSASAPSPSKNPSSAAGAEFGP